MANGEKVSISDRYKSKHILLVSLLFVFLIPVLVSAMNAGISYRAIKDEVNSNNDLLLDTLRKNTDSEMSVLETAMMNIEILNTTNRLSYAATRNHGELSVYIYQMQTELNKMKIANPLIDDITLYFPRNEYIVSQTTAYTKDLLQSGFLLNKGITADGWLLIEQSALTRPKLSLLSDTGAVIFSRILKQERLEPLAYIAITINKKVLLDKLYQNMFHEDAIIMITTEGTALLSTDDSADEARPDFFALYGAEDGVVSYKSAGQDYTVIIKKSTSFNLNYLYIVPTSVFAQKLKGIVTIILVMLVVVVLFGCVSIPRILRLNYKPIEGIIKHLGLTPDDAKKINEFQYIKEEIDRKQANLHNRSEGLQKVLLSHALLTQLTQQELVQLEAMLGTPIPTVYSCILISAIDDDLIKYAVNNVMGELLSESYQYRAVEIGEYIAFVLTTNCDMNSLQALCEKCIAFFHEYFGTDIYIGVGQSVSSADKLHVGYNTAKTALEHLVFFKYGFFAIYYEGNYRFIESEYAISDASTQLTNAIFAGDKDSAERIFAQIMAANVNLPDLSMEQIRDNLHEFYGSLIKINSRVRSTYRDYGADQLFNIEYLYGIKNYASINDTICATIVKITDLVNSGKRDTFADICSEISIYIQNNYMDQELSVNKISEVFHFSPSYLSKNFKANTGDGIPDYINSIRIERAKELLKQGYKIVDVSERCGFANSNSFIRVFKKLEGVTPGSYKEPPQA
ncbi:hypothetical protein FACS18948_2050 [Clostridia bacterium]|nr:hypothetical protein FACS18948_2050 [Clostridia bacterium]